MGYNVKLLVPTKNEAELGPIIGRILGHWGGVTISDASGWATDDNGKPIKDALSVIQCSIGSWDADARAWWFDLADTVRKEWNQESVFLSVTEEKMMLIRNNTRELICI